MNAGHNAKIQGILTVTRMMRSLRFCQCTSFRKSRVNNDWQYSMTLYTCQDDVSMFLFSLGRSIVHYHYPSIENIFKYYAVCIEMHLNFLRNLEQPLDFIPSPMKHDCFQRATWRTQRFLSRSVTQALPSYRELPQSLLPASWVLNTKSTE